MAIWTDAYLNRKAQEAEEEIAKALGCIVDRYCIPVIAGKEIYTLPTPTLGIRQITWKGKLLDPYTFNEMRGIEYIRTIFDGPFELTAFESTAFAVEENPNIQGEPLYYIYDSMGYNKLHLFPVPSESLGSPVAGTNLWLPSNISEYCILEYSRLPDLTGSTFRVPTYLRRRLVKAWVLSKAFAMEGKGQDLEAAEYYTSKYNNGLSRAKLIINSITRINARSNNLDSSMAQLINPILTPVRLPDNYGKVY